MADPHRRRGVFTIPPHRSFADSLAAGLMDEGELPRTLLLLPSRRSVRAMTEAFVRLTDGGLLLPRMLPIGDIGEDEALGLFDETLEIEAALPPAIDGLQRRMLLMTLVRRWAVRTRRPGAAVEMLRLADALAGTLDQLQLEGVPATALAGTGANLGAHWGKTLEFLQLVVQEWPGVLAGLGAMDRAERRQALLGAIADRWRRKPPARRVVAAGMVTADPSAAALLGVIARLPHGRVVLPGVDLETGDWDALKTFPAHPQWALRQLLDRMEVGRGEIDVWDAASGRDGDPHRGAALAAALALPETTAKWPAPSKLAGLKAVEAADPAEESVLIALAMRRALETPGATAALATPDRALARRVAVQLGRWGVAVDDSAGTPLTRTLPGALLALAVDAAAGRFSPAALLALLKHPLAGPEDVGGRLQWLDRVRSLDLALRGVRPAPGLAAITRRLRLSDDKALKAWWRDLAVALKPLEALGISPASLDVTAERLRAFANDFAGERLWRGPGGRAAGELMASLIAHGAAAGRLPPGDLPAVFAELAGGIAVRPPFGKHPRLAIYGLLEARLQRADLMILGGLNEGVWPACDSFDPWLPPAVRRELGLPATERSIGLAAHDFVMAAAAREVLLTRAVRDAQSPTVPSRLWLRLKAFIGELAIDADLLAAARAIDVRSPVPHAPPPSPRPSLAARPRRISVTQVDRLRADPFAFYAQKILRLEPLDPIDADPSAADKGTLVHKMLEALIESGRLHDPVARAEVIAEKLAALAEQPLIDALWRPRVERMLEWVSELLADRARDWPRSFAERKGRMTIAGIELTGTADVVQIGAAGLAIADFKTGRLPSGVQVEAGYALQLGLLANLAQAGALEGVSAMPVTELAYWKLRGGEKLAGETCSSGKNFAGAWGDVPAFVAKCRGILEEVAGRYLTGDAAFTAKAAPEYALHLHDYDHLARLAEWQGRK
jgi:ATP-dependent helicase/nuclease subunit B